MGRAMKRIISKGFDHVEVVECSTEWMDENSFWHKRFHNVK